LDGDVKEENEFYDSWSSKSFIVVEAIKRSTLENTEKRIPNRIVVNEDGFLKRIRDKESSNLVLVSIEPKSALFHSHYIIAQAFF